MTPGAPPRVGLLCVGSELLRGKINLHASTLARRLAALGLELNAESTVGDELPDLTDGVRRLLGRFDIVFVTGGLGPTFDDVTREAAAAATGRALHFAPAILRDIERKFRRVRRRRMPPANRRQAYLLDGARAIANANGTAPGQWLDLPDGRILILLPGPPSELNPMLEGRVLPLLRKAVSSLPRAEAHLHFVGAPESVVDQRVRPIIEKAGPGVQFTILAHLGLVDLDIFVSHRRLGAARRRLKRLAGAIRQVVGKSFYGMDQDYPLEKVVGERFVHRKATLAVAESCTGGLLSARLTEQSGSSRFFKGGVVSYANRVKEGMLGVPETLLRRYGAVSREVALAMAEGVRARLGSTIGLAITGIAGPSGATPGKPVGLVYLAIVSARRAQAHEFRFSGDRSGVRQRAVLAALDLLRRV